MYKDFLYTSRNSSLPREGAWYLTGQDENVSRKGIRSLDQSGLPTASPILSVIGFGDSGGMAPRKKVCVLFRRGMWEGEYWVSYIHYYLVASDHIFERQVY